MQANKDAKVEYSLQYLNESGYFCYKIMFFDKQIFQTSFEGTFVPIDFQINGLSKDTSENWKRMHNYT